MTKYDIISLVIAAIALAFSIPSAILAIIDIKLRIVFITVSFERQHCILYECNGYFKLNVRYNIANKSPIPFTIKKVEAIYNKKVCEIYRDTHNGSGTFKNVSIAPNSSNDFQLSFDSETPIAKKFKLKIYTNSKTIKRKLKLEPNLQSRKESQ